MSALRKLGLVAAAGTLAAGISVAEMSAASANATQWYSSLTTCTSVGHNYVERGVFSSYKCTYVARHNPHWRLYLID